MGNVAAIEASGRVIVEALSGLWTMGPLLAAGPRPIEWAASENRFEIDLGDGGVFADLMGDGMAVIEQSEPCGRSHHAVLDREQIEALLAAEQAGGVGAIELDAETTAHLMGGGVLTIDQLDNDTEVVGRLVLTIENLQRLSSALL